MQKSRTTKATFKKTEAMGKTIKARDAFTLEELRTFFPEDKLKLIEIWKTEKYAIAFFILATTWLRSGELRALQYCKKCR
ncbi:MAG TPA: hypothetical protein PLG43_13015 [Spirochaetia bacterium]|nr:hypothetical protein [Spirochaetia bacterium]